MVLLCESEIWTLPAEHRQRIQAFHVTCQRRILGIQWHDFVTNVDVQRRTELSNVLQIIARRRHSLFGHVRRLDPITPAHAALRFSVGSRSYIRSKSGWRRPAGRSRRLWISQSWKRTKEYLIGSCGGPRKIRGSELLDDPTTISENDHQYQHI